jgi:AmmeMemoRadiSam system protein A
MGRIRERGEEGGFGEALVGLARQAIESAFEPGRSGGDAALETESGNSFLAAFKGSMASGAFVTLRSNGMLRGCIGRMEATGPLDATIVAMARAAAFEDPRFPPLERGELPAISVEVTLLGPRRPISAVEELEVGKHGVHLSLGSRSAVFLPQVAIEQGWDRPRLLRELCRKAGLDPEAWRSPEAVLSVFEGRVFGEKEPTAG